MGEWIRSHQGTTALLGGVGLALSVLSLIALPWFLVRLPADYFAREEPTLPPFARAHPFLRRSLRVARNLLGLLVLASGVAMLLLPGQGLLTVLAGLVLLEFPGKRRFERALVRRPAVRKALGWLRRRAGRTPFLFEPDAPPRPSDESSRGAS